MCDTLVVVRPEGVLFAKNSDRDANEAQVLDWQPRRLHAEGETLRCTWVSLPQVRETHAVLLSRPFWMWGAEIAANEHGVVVGNEAVFTREAVPELGLTGMDLVRLAVERAATARAAVSVITELLEQFGQGGRCGLEVAGFRYFSSFLVADARSAFVLETVGRRWAVEQIRGARSISNGLTLSSFAGDGDPLRTRIARASARRSCTERAGARARDVRDLMKALRDHGHDGLRYGLVNGAMGGPCMHGGGVLAASQTVASWVSDLREGATRHFATGTAAPCTAIFKPVRVDTPVDVGAPTDVADEHSLWWRHERLHRAVMRDPERLLARYVEERDAAEQRFVDEDVAPTLAFAETDQLLARWTADVGAQRAIDRRPRWAQRYWSARGRAARLAPIG